MFHSSPARWLAALAGVAMALPAIAQPASPPAAEPPAAVALPYRSAFENYRRFQDEKPVDWKAANDTVQQRGGWRAYAREGAEAAQPGDPHAGHAGHGDHGTHAAPPAAAGTKEKP